MPGRRVRGAAEGGPEGGQAGGEGDGRAVVPVRGPVPGDAAREAVGRAGVPAVPEGPPLAGVLPMRASVGGLPAEGVADDYAVELKWDGVRALVHVWDGRVMVRSRIGRDVTSSYPELAGLSSAVGGSVVLDGEIVAFDGSGRPSFQRLQQRLGATSRAAVERGVREAPAVLVIFDVLYLDGMVTVGLPYRERRQLVDELGLEGPAWTTPGVSGTPAAALLEAVRVRGLEGIVLKKWSSVYVPGKRSEAWVKVKLHRRQELVVGGWSPGAGARRGGIGALLLGYYDESGRFRYAGSVGTGFSQEALARIESRLMPLRRAASPFSEPVSKRGAVFVEPSLVVEVEFSEWTREGRLRHPSFQGVREDVEPMSVVREEPADAGEKDGDS